MRRRSLRDVAARLEGRICGASPSATVTGASIDTRSLEPGQLFFAVPGTRANGVDFAQDALHRGAPAVVVARGERSRFEGAAIAVDDPARALARLARSIREEERHLVPAVAVTGSVGKTTTCRYVAQLIGGDRRVHRPPGSFNNHLGVPLTILNAADRTEVLVVEVGSSAMGEVHALASLVKPRSACVTSVAPAHLESFGNLDAVEVEKLSILDALPSSGQGWIPSDLARRHSALLSSHRGEIRTFGPGAELEIRPRGADRWELCLPEEKVTFPFEWAPPFPHSPRNLEAALGLGLGLGLEPGALLERVGQLTLPPLRGEVRRHAGVDFLLDCYNSNPTSLESAIERLEKEPAAGRRFCVVGTMEELGEEEARWHRELGGRLASAHVDQVFVMGRGGRWYQEGLRRRGRRGEALEADGDSARRLAEVLKPGDRVLFKASRRERLEAFAERVARFLEGKRVTV